MKVLIIHYRYYLNSGPEKYLFSITKLLNQKKHTVIPFSIRYIDNLSSLYSKYFVEPIIQDFHFNMANISICKKIQIIINSFYNLSAYRHLKQLIKDEKPDIAYIMQYGIKLSTSIFDVCKKNNIPIVLRLSDYSLICGKNILYRNGEICTKCIKGIHNCLKYKCIHNSLSQSFVYYLVQKFNQIRKVEKSIHTIVAPSLFTIQMISKTKQYRNNRFVHIPTFYSQTQNYNLKERNVMMSNSLKLSYWGRISEDKGVDLLIESLRITQVRGYKFSLKIIGDTNSFFGQKLLDTIEAKRIDDITFMGYIPNELIYDEISDTHFSVIPSKWYDNMPNTLIESSSFGIPVIVSEVGSLKELIKDGYNGFTFKNNDAENLASKLIFLSKLNDASYKEISLNAIKWIKEYCNEEKHYTNLINVFNKAIYETNSRLNY